jgi:hypothetical protein
MEITKTIKVPSEWVGGHLTPVILTVTCEIFTHESRIVPILKTVTSRGFELMLVRNEHIWDLHNLIEMEVINEYATIKLNSAESNLYDYAGA